MRTTIVRALAILSVVVLMAVMVGVTLRPDWPETTVRIGFLIAVIGSGWLGGLGAVVGRSSAIAVGVVGLFLLGFWQAAL